MNAAEKARLAKEKREDAKRQKRMRAIAKCIKTVEILFVVATIAVVVMNTVYMETKNITSLALWYKIGIWTLVANAVGVVVSFYMATKETDAAKSENLVGVTSFLFCACLVLILMLFFGVKPMIQA